MDLSFTRFEGRQVQALPGDLAVLLVGIAARQAVSPTARLHAALLAGTARRAWYRPRSGAFNAAVADLLNGLSGEVKPLFTEPL